MPVITPPAPGDRAWRSSAATPGSSPMRDPPEACGPSAAPANAWDQREDSPTIRDPGAGGTIPTDEVTGGIGHNPTTDARPPRLPGAGRCRPGRVSSDGAARRGPR